MESSSNSDDPPANSTASTSAAASSSTDDATIAQLGPDVTACYNFILDQQLAKDGGGTIAPIDSCPHIAEHVKVTAKDVSDYFANSNLAMLEIPCCMPPNQKKPTGGLKSEVVVATEEEGSNDVKEEHCPLGENWFCLATQKILCSRYVNGHALQHWKDTANCIAVSLADLSVWCHVCEAYIKDKSGPEKALVLKPILQALEDIKFGGGGGKEAGANTTGAKT
ncbi:unnamed protein product [Cylindrotheca closterium]|uniref:UBP-type domain-containing protein n=1 Tax=Cylindrotheca closterium TaxID=2856 RepID=A0AAD2JJ32_9STRA|nr:unnamed protein product [Cylindrotheca closterium]